MSLSTYYLLSDLNIPVKVKINSLRGKSLVDELDLKSAQDYSPITATRNTELVVTCQIFSNSQPLSMAQSTTYKCFSPENMRWREWITFPVKYRDLSLTSFLVFTLWEVAPLAPLHSPLVDPKPHAEQSPGLTDTYPDPRVSKPTMAERPIGGAAFPMFNKRGVLKLGRRKIFLTPDTLGDGVEPSRTPHKVGEPESIDRLHKMVRRWEQRELPKVDWLNKLALRRIKKLQENQPTKPEHTFLSIEFPPFKHTIVYHQVALRQPLPELGSMREDRLFVIHDPEIARDNPIEAKYHKLERGAKGISFKDLKPNRLERKRIDELILSPNKQMAMEDRELLYKFRYSITDNKRALTKFLRCVNWTDQSETKEAVSLVERWAPIDTEDALELLSKFFTNPDIRRYAVRVLEQTPNEDLNSYLLQLVQALRYEEKYPNALSEFLTRRALSDFELANFLHWFLKVESDEENAHSPAVKMYRLMHKHFLDTLKQATDTCAEWLNQIEAEERLVQQLVELGTNASSKGGKVAQRIDRMRSILTEGGEMGHLLSFAPVKMPVRPDTLVTGVVPKESTMFKSALAPLLCCFLTPLDQYKVIFKKGDDLRQDQLIIQMINLMDSVLKKWNFDLKLTPYRVLATSMKTGFVEFVPNSKTLTSILEEYDKDIRKFLSKHNPKPQSLAKAVDNFVKSCAGYCLITYILGIGDRHLDNVLMTIDGHLFHIDFGWIFGRDPKPFPPPMKFCKEMVEAMGGRQSRTYTEFRRNCCTGFNILRKHSALILNLLSLMGDANIPHLMDDVNKNILKVQEKFRLDLNDQESEHYILSLVDESVNALFPQFLDRVHNWALYWR